MISTSTAIFSNKELKSLILPLFAEQLLTMLVGIADTFAVSFVGEAAVSGVSLVNAFNTIFIYLFTALASGGAVIISQYIGRNEFDTVGKASSQLLSFSILFSVITALLIIGLNETLIKTIFGRVEENVSCACVTYLRISAYSYPALAVYNAGAALYRSFGKTSTTMYISIIANAINVIGNLIGVFVLNAGVAGVAYPSLISRIFSAVVITALCFSKKNIANYRLNWILKLNPKLLRQMLKIAVPNGVESGIFQLVKVALSSIVAMFGTYQIAANGIAQSIWSMASLVSVTMGPVFITVIGQCMGADNISEAERSFKKLIKITLIFSFAWNAAVFAATPILLNLYSIPKETKRLVILLVLIHNIFNTVAFPFADPLGKGLRATGDVKFTALVSLGTTIGVRLTFSILFGLTLNLGVIGIAWAMCLDWVLRGIVFWCRYKQNKWKKFKVI